MPGIDIIIHMPVSDIITSNDTNPSFRLETDGGYESEKDYIREESDMKKTIRMAILLALAIIIGSAAAVQAEIIPPEGEGQIGLPAVVLCEELTMRKDARTSSGTVTVLEFGARISVMRQTDGWAYCVFGDSEDSPAGWVNADYIFIDPAWYRTDGKTPVYAWNDPAAPRVALLDKGVELPILKEDGDWLIVSLRGAVGWIRIGPNN